MTVYTVSQLADRWQCDVRVVLSAIHTGRLRAFPLRPGAKRPTWRIPADAVQQCESGAVQDKPKPVRRRRKDRPVGWVEYF